MEAIASPKTHERILIEDIVVDYKNEHKVYIQAKKTKLTIKRGDCPTLKICFPRLKIN
ncbi:Isocitrate lyase [Candidatus Brocadia sinica JPN1]|uniref:Isocitrate lyase n=1 Tax=Candidatus Brocadia sinica JPN1 TaxID=1197129 RepID=A0ABQ0K0R9_9BACT|nr:Isocitrate lyase [Candidatus Brocadia sinica JPN1]